MKEVIKDKSKYGVFIIESMDLENELNGNLDGLVLSKILKLCGIPYEYYYVRTKKEFYFIVDKFHESSLRFIHIACHGDEKGLSFCYDYIDFAEFEEILGDYLKYRRLFLSACKVARFSLAKLFIPKYHCYSVIGTPENIDYDKAAIFWSSFYYLMYENDQNQMFQIDILPTLKKISKTFQVNLNYYSIINNRNPVSLDHLREIHIRNGRKRYDKVRQTEFKNIFRKEKVSYNLENEFLNTSSS